MTLGNIMDEIDEQKLADLDRRTREHIERKRSGEPSYYEPPRTKEPSIEQLMLWDHEGGCETTCGCWVESDGYCEHGNPSWLLVLGMI